MLKKNDRIYVAPPRHARLPFAIDQQIEDARIGGTIAAFIIAIAVLAILYFST